MENLNHRIIFAISKVQFQIRKTILSSREMALPLIYLSW